MISNFNNDVNRGGDRVVGYKPLMYFCFDEIVHARNRIETVAVTCPKVNKS